MRPEFPFSAIVGQDDLKLALLLVAVDPTIGGVLITGERGTAKSTAARGVAALLPATSAGKAAPFVELPLGATEDRVVGSLDLAKILQDGSAQLRSGLLAHANGGVLYVDEVNLLPDHIVDLLLDAAASGWVTVERDGISAGEAARFVLVGTMNPDEGELRPQFVDRFGLCVQVRGLDARDERIAAIRRRLAFDENPAAVMAAAQPAEDALRSAILAARARLASLVVTDAQLSAISALAIERHLDGIRGDLAIVKAARALAAWQAVSEVSDEHIRRAAELALPHRSHRAKTTRTHRSSQGSDPPERKSVPPDREDRTATAAPRPADNPRLQPAPPAPSPDAISLNTELVDRARSGRRGREAESSASRRAIGIAPFKHSGTLAVAGTVTAAARRGVRVSEHGVALAVADLMQHERGGPGISYVLFLVDASGSMATQRRLEAAKGAALGLLTSSYQRRDEVALMVFRGEGTDLVLPFTRDVASVEIALSEVPTGGRTPLARALLDAAQLLRARQPALLVLLTDGRANVSVGDGDPWDEALAACGALRAAAAGALVVDCETGPIVIGRARVLARALEAQCVALGALDDSGLKLHIHRRLETL